MNEIDEIRCQRDVARTENARLKTDNERLAMLLYYARQAIHGEYLLRVTKVGE